MSSARAASKAVTVETLGAWVFTCNPKTWDIHTFIADGNDRIDDWSVTGNYRSAMIRDGQRAVLWVCGPEHGDTPRGIWGLGWTTGPCFEVTDVDAGYWTDADKAAAVRWMAPTDIELLAEPIDTATLRSHPGLADLEIIRSPQTGNPSWISVAQLASLEELIDEWPAADRFAGDTITVSGGGARRGDPAANRIVEQAAVERTTAHYESLGYTVEDVGHRKLGWDLTCTAMDGNTRRVEVKGVSGKTPSILLTRNELRSAREVANWELAVVTQALAQPRLRIHSAAEVVGAAIGYVYQVDLDDGQSP